MFGASRPGFVYVASAPQSFPGWTRVGVSGNPKKRVSSHNGSTPYRDFVIFASFRAENGRRAERAAHQLLEEKHRRASEWFQCSPEEAAESARLAVDEANDYIARMRARHEDLPTCTECGVQKGRGCVSSDGKPLRLAHLARRGLALPKQQADAVDLLRKSTRKMRQGASDDDLQVADEAAGKLKERVSGEGERRG